MFFISNPKEIVNLFEAFVTTLFGGLQQISLSTQYLDVPWEVLNNLYTNKIMNWSFKKQFKKSQIQSIGYAKFWEGRTFFITGDEKSGERFLKTPGELVITSIWNFQQRSTFIRYITLRELIFAFLDVKHVSRKNNFCLFIFNLMSKFVFFFVIFDCSHKEISVKSS